MNKMRTYSAEDFAHMVGARADDSHVPGKDGGFPDLRFRRLEPEERAQTLLVVEEELTKDLRRSGDANPDCWDRGWAEVLDRVHKEGVTPQTLCPQYYGRPKRNMRLSGEFVWIEREDFELELYRQARTYYYKKYGSDVERIVDFGCGTCMNQLLLGSMFPKKRQIACDWASPSQELAGLVAKQHAMDLKGVWFDMLSAKGGDAIEREPRSMFTTFHAMEQLGEAFGPFLNFLMDHRPELCFHMEPIYELYDRQNPFDELAAQYHLKRNYLRGYLPAVEDLQAKGKAKIIEKRRLGFGNLFHEAYTVLVWKPL